MLGMRFPQDWLLRAGLIGSLIVRAILWFAIVSLVIGLGYIAIADNAGFAELDADLAQDGISLGGKAAMLVIFGFVLVIVVLFDRILVEVQGIIASVCDGDPFVPSNANRLERIGWMLLATQVLALIGMSISAVEALAQEWNFAEQFSLEGLFAVLLVFILARIFRHGSALREDLEGTV